MPPGTARASDPRLRPRSRGSALAQTGHRAAGDRASDPAARSRRTKGRSWVLSAQVQSYGIALTVTFLALLLAAGAAAAERDEGTVGRLRRGLVSLGQLVWSKVALAAVVGARARRGDRRRLRDRRRGRRRHGRRAVGAHAAPARRRRARGRRRRRRRHAARRARARGADGVAPRGARRAAGRLPRPRAARRARRSRTGSASSCRSPTPSAGSARRSTTRAPGGTLGDRDGVAARHRRGALGAWRHGSSMRRLAAWAALARRTLLAMSSLPRRPASPLPPHRRRCAASSARRSSPRPVRDAALRRARVAAERGSCPGCRATRSTTSCARSRSSSARGVQAVILFGIPEEKDEQATGAWEDDGIVQQALRALRPRFPELVLMTDVCLCEYTSHGHCGVIVDGEVHNDQSLELLARTAVVARRGRRRRRRAERHDGRPRARDPRGARRRTASSRRRSSRTRRSTRPRSTARSARPPTRRRRSATAAATRWIPRTCARRCASASSTSRRAPTRS